MPLGALPAAVRTDGTRKEPSECHIYGLHKLTDATKSVDVRVFLHPQFVTLVFFGKCLRLLPTITEV